MNQNGNRRATKHFVRDAPDEQTTRDTAAMRGDGNQIHSLVRGVLENGARRLMMDQCPRLHPEPARPESMCRVLQVRLHLHAPGLCLGVHDVGDLGNQNFGDEQGDHLEQPVLRAMPAERDRLLNGILRER